MHAYLFIWSAAEALPKYASVVVSKDHRQNPSVQTESRHAGSFSKNHQHTCSHCILPNGDGPELRCLLGSVMLDNNILRQSLGGSWLFRIYRAYTRAVTCQVLMYGRQHHEQGSGSVLQRQATFALMHKAYWLGANTMPL